MPVKKPTKLPEPNAEAKIKAAARIVFHKKGFAATRTRDIAKEAKMNLALLNYYFKSKEKLFELVMLETLGTFFQAMGMVFNDESTSLEKKVQLVAEKYIDVITAEPEIPLFMMSEVRGHGAAILEKLPVINLVMQSWFIKQYREAVQQGKITEPNPLHFLMNILGLVVFPFIASPMIKKIGRLSDRQFDKLMQERKTDPGLDKSHAKSKIVADESNEKNNELNMIKSFLIGFMCLLAATGPVAAQTLYIDSCYALATRNYPLIKQYELIEKTKEYTLSNAGKAWLPQVSVTAIEGYIFGELPKFGSNESGSNLKFIGLGQVNQTLWDGGATKTQKNIISAQSETDKASVDVALNDLKSRVNQLYFGILLIDEQLKQLEVQNTILGNNVNRIKQLRDNGLAYNTDIDEIKVEQLKLHQQKIEFNYTRNGYAMMLSLLIGQKISEQTILQKPILGNQFTDLQIIRPELSLYKSQRNLINAQSEMQKVNLMPKLGLLGAAVLITPGVSFGNSKTSTLGVAGISASWNISGLYKNANEKQLTQLSLTKINVQEETFLFNTRLQLTQASANIEKQKAVLSEDDEIVSLRKTIREGYQEKYNSGVSPLFDFLNATEKEREARAQKALHEMQLIMTLYDYKTISGN